MYKMSGKLNLIDDVKQQNNLVLFMYLVIYIIYIKHVAECFILCY